MWRRWRRCAPQPPLPSLEVAITRVRVRVRVLGSGSSSEQSLPQDEEQFDSLSLRSLSADGEGQVDTYDLIRSFAGPNPIEAPDLYEVNHPGSPHIFEATDQDVGDHFVFVIPQR